MMNSVRIGLKPVASEVNLTTCIKTATFPGDVKERVFIATQVGEIFYIDDEGNLKPFLDITSKVINLTENNTYDERGLLGLAFHPEFNNNGVFYIHYTVAGSLGAGTGIGMDFIPDPCNDESINLEWTNRKTYFDHVDTIEEWILDTDQSISKIRTLLNLRAPFMNHNGVNSLNFSKETANLVFTPGDGGAAYDPFNLSQNLSEIHGKIIEFDIINYTSTVNQPIVSRFNELPRERTEHMYLIAKGARNLSGITYQWINNRYHKYIGNAGQDMVEAIYSFSGNKLVKVSDLINNPKLTEDIVNFGWRGLEGEFPTSIPSTCQNNQSKLQISYAYYNEAIATATKRIPPLTSYYHYGTRTRGMEGSALIGVQVYLGSEIPELTGKIIFGDFAANYNFINNSELEDTYRGFLAYTNPGDNCKINDHSILEIDYNFYSSDVYFTCLSSNSEQTKLYLAIYNSPNVADENLGTVFEIVKP